MWRLIRLGLCGCILIGLLAEGASAFFLTSRAITSVFDTARNSTANSVFSNGNTKVTAGPSTVTNVQLSAFTNVVHSSGKYAFRVTENACTSAGLQGCAIGLGSVSDADNNYLGISTSGVAIFDSGNIYLGGANIGAVAGFLPGNTVDVEVDLDAKTISDSVNGGAFSTPVSIAGLSSFALSPAVTMNDPTDAFTYNGNVSFPGFAAWNSAPSPPVTGTGACTGVASVFGLTCNPAFSDNFDGTTVNTSFWTTNGYPPSSYAVANGLLTLGLGNQGVVFNCVGNCIPGPLPNYWEIRFRQNNDTATVTPSAIWTQSNLPPLSVTTPLFNGSTAPGKQLEIDVWERQFSGGGGYNTEAGFNMWDTTGGGPPFQVTHDNAVNSNNNCMFSPPPDSGQCFHSSGGGNLADGQFHTIGVHRFVNGSGGNQVDFYRDGILYTSATLSSSYTSLITLPQTTEIWWTPVNANNTEDVDYVRVWN